jgi:hypothetical protein
MRRLIILLALAAAFALPTGAEAALTPCPDDMNCGWVEAHWPTTTQDVNGCYAGPESRCIAIYDHTGWSGNSSYRTQLRNSLLDIGREWQSRFQFTLRYYAARTNLDTCSVSCWAQQYRGSPNKMLGAIYIGYGSDWAQVTDVSQLAADPEFAAPAWYSPDNPHHTRDCFIAIDNPYQETIEHELGHCIGLEHWALDANYNCEVFSVMCALGDPYNHLAWRDYRTLNFLYGHSD